MKTKTIWRFDFPLSDKVIITMPKGARICSCALSDRMTHSIAAWAIVDLSEPEVRREINVRGTGHKFGDIGKYVSTVFDGPLVWHIFDAGEVPE